MQSVNANPIKITVTSGMPVPEPLLDELRAMDPRLRVQAVPAEQRPFLQAGRGDDPDPAARALAATLAETEIVLVSFELPRDLPQRTPKLRWLHTFAAGVERLVEWGFLDHGIPVTNGSGPTATPIAEYILMTLLMLSRNATCFVRSQDAHRWERQPGNELRGKTVGIVGLGNIGREAGRLATAFGCRVIGIRRSVTAAQGHVQGVDLLLPPSDLPRLLAESDFVVLTAPATAETAALIDEAALRRMKRSAFLINIARGSLVDEAALLAALKEERLAGAALDVFQQEPLPPDSGLWDCERVIVTPHNSPASEHFMRRQIDLAKENLRRYLNGEPLLNLVTSDRGY